MIGRREFGRQQADGCEVDPSGREHFKDHREPAGYACSLHPPMAADLEK